MNEAEFYKGMMVELQKSAVVQPPLPKKHSMWPGVAMGALGAGALGLGAYGLYKGLKPIASAVANPAATDPEPTKVWRGDEATRPTAYDNAALGATSVQATGDSADLLTSLSSHVGDASGVGRSGIADAVEAGGGLASKLRWFQPLKPLSNLGMGVGFVAQGLNPNSDAGPWSRASQIGGGGTLASAQVLDSRLGPAASKILPQALRDPALTGAAKLIGDTGLRFVPGLGQVYTAAGLAQGSIAATTAFANQHSNRINEVGSMLANSYKGLHENNLTSPDYSPSILNSHDLFDSKAGQKLTKQVTNPNIFARIGYGWGNTSPDTTSLQKDYAKEKSLFDNIVKSRGLHPQLIHRDLDTDESKVPEAYANSYPATVSDGPEQPQNPGILSYLKDRAIEAKQTADDTFEWGERKLTNYL